MAANQAAALTLGTWLCSPYGFIAITGKGGNIRKELGPQVDGYDHKIVSYRVHLYSTMRTMVVMGRVEAYPGQYLAQARDRL